MPIRITTLIENSVAEGLDLQIEHGLSFFIELGGQRRLNMLFDTGQSDKFMGNARALNIDLKKTDFVAISHGHYDHSGGFRDFRQRFGNNFRLFLGEGFFNPKYAGDQGQYRFLGNNFDQDYLREKEIKTTFVEDELLQIAPGVHLMRNFPPGNDFELPNPRFQVFKDSSFELDLFADEIVLILETSQGLVVLLGCSHPGVVNILETIRSRLNKRLHGVIGGSHLMEADQQRLQKTFEYFRSLNLSMLSLSHCTGEIALSLLGAGDLPYLVNSTGTVVDFTPS